MPKLLVDMIGQRFGRLVVVGRAPSRPGVNGARWRCRCDCGGEVIACRQHLMRGSVQSCGCIRRERGQRMGALARSMAGQPQQADPPSTCRTTTLHGRLDIDLLLAVLALIDREPLQTQAGIAEQLAVSRPTISRTLAQAEATLGVAVVVTQQHGPGLPRWTVRDWGVLDRSRALARGAALLALDPDARRRAYRQA